ncbi:MAG: hypothetical protein EA411_13210, partial [Saprospirales bacterium]
KDSKIQRFKDSKIQRFKDLINNPLILLICLVFLLQSCEKEIVDIEPRSTDYPQFGIERTLSEDSVDYYLEVFAKTIAVSLEDNEFRDFIERRVKSDDGGKASVLYLQTIDSIVGENKIPEFLAQKSVIAENPRDSLFFASELISLIPNLSISVYPGDNIVDIDNWSFSSSGSLPPVMPVTEVYNDTSETQNIAFYKDLTTTYFSNIEDPSTSVVTVQPDPYFVPINKETLEQLGGHKIYSMLLDMCEELEDLIREEIDLLGSITPILIETVWPPVFTFNPEFIVVLINLQMLIETFEAECGEWDGGEPGNGNECDRDTRECREIINAARFTSRDAISEFCKWALFGRDCFVEVHTMFIALDDNDNPILETPPTKFMRAPRWAWRTLEFLPIYLPMYWWQYLDGVHGDLYAYDFIGIHHQSGTERTFNLGIGFTSVEFEDIGTASINASYTVQRKHNDFELGGDIIYYCDKANGDGELYTTGLLEFFVAEIEDCD